MSETKETTGQGPRGGARKPLSLKRTDRLGARPAKLQPRPQERGRGRAQEAPDDLGAGWSRGRGARWPLRRCRRPGWRRQARRSLRGRTRRTPQGARAGRHRRKVRADEEAKKRAEDERLRVDAKRYSPRRPRNVARPEARTRAGARRGSRGTCDRSAESPTPHSTAARTGGATAEGAAQRHARDRQARRGTRTPEGAVPQRRPIGRRDAEDDARSKKKGGNLSARPSPGQGRRREAASAASSPSTTPSTRSSASARWPR